MKISLKARNRQYILPIYPRKRPLYIHYLYRIDHTGDTSVTSNASETVVTETTTSETTTTITTNTTATEETTVVTTEVTQGGGNY